MDGDYSKTSYQCKWNCGDEASFVMCINNVVYFVLMKLKHLSNLFASCTKTKITWDCIFKWLNTTFGSWHNNCSCCHWWKVTYISGKFLLFPPQPSALIFFLIPSFSFLIHSSNSYLLTLCMPWFFILSFLIHSYVTLYMSWFFIHIKHPVKYL